MKIFILAIGMIVTSLDFAKAADVGPMIDVVVASDASGNLINKAGVDSLRGSGGELAKCSETVCKWGVGVTKCCDTDSDGDPLKCVGAKAFKPGDCEKDCKGKYKECTSDSSCCNGLACNSSSRGKTCQECQMEGWLCYHDYECCGGLTCKQGNYNQKRCSK